MTSKSMKAKAAVLYGAGERVRVEEVEVMAPGRGEVTVRMKAAGVCHSDLHVMKGDLKMPMPIIMGHEGAGVVEAVGEGVESVEAGDHVIPIWRTSCGVCEYCMGGRPALCDVGTAMRFTGLMPDGTTRFRTAGGDPVLHYAGVSTFSELSTMTEGAVVKIPKDYKFEHAALLGCGVITGVGAVFNAARVTLGSSVAVWGCGGIGLNAIQGAKLAGAAKVIGVDRVTSKLEDAKTMGATEVVDGSAGDAMEAVKALTGGKGVDFAIEAIGLPGSVEEAYGATKKGGTCVVVGIMPPEPRVEIDAHALVYAEKTLKGSLYGSARPRVDLLALMEMHRAGKLMLDELLTRTYELEEINEAYADLEAGKLARGLIVF